MARLLDAYSDLEGKRVLDLGCGLGVPGICAARRGARVVFADRNPDALAFAQWNGARQAAGQGSVEVLQLDWSAEDVAGTFDIILLADVTYRPVHHAGVMRQVERCLDTGGIVIHSEPWRPEANAFVRRLEHEWLTAVASWRVVTEDEPVIVRMAVASRSAEQLASWRGFLERRATGDGAVR